MGLFTDVETVATVTYVTNVSGSIINNHDHDVDDTITYIDDTATVIYNDVEEDLTTVSGVFRDDVEYLLYLIDNLDTNLSAVQVRRTTNYDLTMSGTNITFDTIDLENNEDALDYDAVGNQKITIGEPGLFFITYSGRCTTSGTTGNVYARVMKNGSDVVIGSDITISVSNGEITNEGGDFIVIFSVDDYITFNMYADDNDCSVLADIVFTITHMRGKQGPPGEDGIDGFPGVDGADGADGVDGLPGAGSVINVLEDGVLTASGVSNLKFEGDVVSLIDYGGGHATVTVSGVDSYPTIESNNVSISSSVDTFNFDGNSTVVDEGSGKVTITTSGYDDHIHDNYYTKDEINTISGTLSTYHRGSVVFTASPTYNGDIPLLGWYIKTDPDVTISGGGYTSLKKMFHSHPVINVKSTSGAPFDVNVSGTVVNESTGIYIGSEESVTVTGTGYYQYNASFINTPVFSIVEPNKECTMDIYKTTYWDNGNKDFIVEGCRFEWTPDQNNWELDVSIMHFKNNGSFDLIDRIIFNHNDKPIRALANETGKYKRADYAHLVKGSENEGIILFISQDSVGSYYLELKYKQ